MKVGSIEDACLRQKLFGLSENLANLENPENLETTRKARNLGNSKQTGFPKKWKTRKTGKPILENLETQGKPDHRGQSRLDRGCLCCLPIGSTNRASQRCSLLHARAKFESHKGGGRERTQF